MKPRLMHNNPRAVEYLGHRVYASEVKGGWLCWIDGVAAGIHPTLFLAHEFARGYLHFLDMRRPPE